MRTDAAWRGPLVVAVRERPPWRDDLEDLGPRLATQQGGDVLLGVEGEPARAGHNGDIQEVVALPCRPAQRQCVVSDGTHEEGR
eukprot:3713538-Pyramimonas_sp.AAC.1